MKRLYKYAILAFAIITFSSCAKEELANIDEPEEESAQLITASFSNNEGTKTTLSSDGLTPVWSEGDKIMLYNSNGEKYKEITLSKTEGPSSVYGKLSEDCSSFTFKKPTEFGADNIMHALYPSSCAQGISSSNLLFSIPTSTKGTFAEANICGAKLDLSKSTSMSFKNLTSIIKINDKTSSITKMTITANAGSKEKNMISGSYKVTDFSKTNATVEFSAGGTDLITITPEKKVGPYYAAVAPVAVSGKIGSYYRGDTEVGAKTLSLAKKFVVNKIYNIGFANPTGSIGVFTVSAGDDGKQGTSDDIKVAFSPGNLQAVYSTSSYSWQFAENQWTYIGNAEGNTTIDSQVDGKKVDLFGRSTAATNYGINTSQDNAEYSGNFVDWGNNSSLISAIGSGWRTLSGGSGGEWKYLLSTRIVNGGTGEGKSYRRANINYVSETEKGVYGMILYPDSYTAQTSATTYSSSDWQTMESAGCVFLPAAGYRPGSSVNDAGSIGNYWSSTPYDSDLAYRLDFDKVLLEPASTSGRCLGQSVRLVQE